MLGTPRCAALDRPPIHVQHAMQTPLVGRISPFWSFVLLQDFLKKNHSYFLCQRGFSYENLLLHWDKGKAMQVCICWYKVGTACRLLQHNHPIVSALHGGRCGAQHRPAGDAVCTALTCASTGSLSHGSLILGCAWRSSQDHCRSP